MKEDAIIRRVLLEHILRVEFERDDNKDRQLAYINETHEIQDKLKEIKAQAEETFGSYDEKIRTLEAEREDARNWVRKAFRERENLENEILHYKGIIKKLKSRKTKSRVSC